MLPDKSNARKKAFRHGITAEWLALAWLLCKGYRLVQWRFKSRWGEVDLIVRKGDVLAFVEVKARKNRRACAESITRKKQEKLCKTIGYFLCHHPLADRRIRIDAVYICPGHWPEHIKNAASYCLTS